MSYFPRPPVSHQDRLLVVDDLPDNSFLIQAILEEEGYQIAIEDNGKDALARIEQSPPDLVLLDVMMPEMDGYEVTRRIRENPSLPFIPILLITAYDQPSLVKGLDTGADDFVRKPVEVDELLARVRSLLRLKHTLDERDHIAKQREDFVSRLAHDLRTPLVAADRMLQLFLDGALGELPLTIQEATGTLARSNQNLLEMVNTLLQVYRYEAGRQTLNLQAMDLRGLIAEVAQQLKPLIQEKGLSLDLDCAKDVPQVLGDRLELRRVITNLLGNAIKFTDQGKISIHLRTVSAPPQGSFYKQQQPRDWVELEVEDTGSGISAEDQAKIFNRFQQGQHRRAGSGLGLHLSRCIVEAHQGEIEAKSKLGEGSCFIVRLPVAK
ncbi:Two-component system sensor histidine kinase/response regulator hybrid [uncultured Synechococcales cyanobacterium]|uniref:Circadian input-output histidine kinase CikA n=1 Tax=uncultured Synechococcales cyanobacterium TaxID=1936017 RepID=A0A6J4VXF9_9CYAN|nr:Two-component system sensor histidine kinase/response regulator hybrid [uncultured Synechococcales cyanobacterium]